MVRMPCGHLVRVSETGQQLRPGKCVTVANFLLLNPELYNYTVKSYQCTILNIQRNWQKNPKCWDKSYTLATLVLHCVRNKTVHNALSSTVLIWVRCW